MKAIVLAGGYATRMWPITRHRPKMLLPLGEGTVIGRILSQLEVDERIDETYVSVNRRFAGEFETFLAASEFERPRVSVEETESELEKLGVVGALGQLVEREGIDDDLLIVAGDNLLGFPMREFVDAFRKREAPTIATYDVGDLEKASSYGLVEVTDGRVTSFQEKPENPGSTLVSIACYALPRDAIAFDEYLTHGNNPDEIGWFVQWLQARQSVYTYSFDDVWYDIGSAESYLDAVGWTLEGESVVAESATVEDSTLEENVHVMGGATVTDSRLRDTVVFPETEIENSEIGRSIVDQYASISDIELNDALVGPYTSLNR
ncbi:NDP-sugar synthase [Natronococcus sp. A-GB1]|uniref:NDP-sugar synthase n=1 Tax=Natronococcus sp. A-GB1 TaxID=3037648 RepID=UPI00241EF214|nr:NDP-sugar synthase [Natronococcus sp. A-GB1]MDG5761229.1 NDP-sugar synthase [Natronococcus sp. A-GB1]